MRFLRVQTLSYLAVMLTASVLTAPQQLSSAELEEIISMLPLPQQEISPMTIEARSSQDNGIEGLDNGYLVFAVADVDDRAAPSAPLKLQQMHVIPKVKNNMLARNVQAKEVAAEDADEESRMLAMFHWKKYARRLMRMIKKSTRMFGGHGHFRSADPEGRAVEKEPTRLNIFFQKDADEVLRPLQF